MCVYIYIYMYIYIYIYTYIYIHTTKRNTDKVDPHHGVAAPGRGPPPRNEQLNTSNNKQLYMLHYAVLYCTMT